MSKEILDIDSLFETIHDSDFLKMHKRRDLQYIGVANLFEIFDIAEGKNPEIKPVSLEGYQEIHAALNNLFDASDRELDNELHD
ncbi:hypothetical protein KKA14_06620 [bacterium]|nr:hypothetical protein [bacterium]